jgi:hypothetical protein
MGGPMAPIEPLFPIQPLSSENLPCSVLMDGPLLPIEPLFPIELCHLRFYLPPY